MPEAASAQATRAAIGDSEFDRDTALVLRAPGVYDIDLSAGWTIINAVNGGYLLAVLGRALADALPHADPFTISAHYLTASQPGPAVVRTETELVLKSRWVLPERLLEAGYDFAFPELEPALRDIVGARELLRGTASR